MHSLAKLTAKNQLTLPKKALESLGLETPPAYFEIDEGRITLSPAQVGSAEAVRRKLDELGIADSDVAEAVAWTRGRR